MKRVAICVLAVVFLLLNWMALGFSETEKSTEDVMREKGLISEEAYNAAKKTRSDLKQKPSPQTQQPESSSGNQQQVWELGTEMSQITYKEPGVMEEKGMMYGIVGSYVYRGESFELQKVMFKAEGRFAFGKVDYDGALQTEPPTPYTIDGIDDYLWEFRGLWGYDFSVFTASTLTPYIGIGYRYLNDDGSSDPNGYERESNYIYSPMGVEITIPLKNTWSVGTMLEYDIFWWGKQISHFIPGYLDAENLQKKGFGIRSSVKFQKKGEKLDFVIEPFIRYWNIKQSETAFYSVIVDNEPLIIAIWEPKNNSTELGCKLAVKF